MSFLDAPRSCTLSLGMASVFHQRAVYRMVDLDEGKVGPSAPVDDLLWRPWAAPFFGALHASCAGCTVLGIEVS